ncbi:uncharacterized protein G2W53_003645 [Senna tora]|uniref:Uncharacterized protein n=1 Tax=Senna tora TaxID=362788 RepID=A0A834XB32_9FABA|nr:uncharacterized protein G2W53_003645 [Senna tora]
MSFVELKQLIHHTLKLPPNQEVSEIIYRMPYGRNPVKFLSPEVSDDEGMDGMLDCHMKCLEFFPIPMIEICANTSVAAQQFEATDYIPHIEFNRRGDQECGTSQAFEGDDINEDGLEMAHEMLNMSTTELNDELLDDEEFDTLTGNDIEDPPNGVEYEDKDFDDNSDIDADGMAHEGRQAIEPIRYFVPNEAQSQCNVPPTHTMMIGVLVGCNEVRWDHGAQELASCSFPEEAVQGTNDTKRVASSGGQASSMFDPLPRTTVPDSCIVPKHQHGRPPSPATMGPDGGKCSSSEATIFLALHSRKAHWEWVVGGQIAEAPDWADALNDVEVDQWHLSSPYLLPLTIVIRSVSRTSNVQLRPKSAHGCMVCNPHEQRHKTWSAQEVALSALAGSATQGPYVAVAGAHDLATNNKHSQG